MHNRIVEYFEPGIRRETTHSIINGVEEIRTSTFACLHRPEHFGSGWAFMWYLRYLVKKGDKDIVTCPTLKRDDIKAGTQEKANELYLESLHQLSQVDAPLQRGARLCVCGIDFTDQKTGERMRHARIDLAGEHISSPIASVLSLRNKEGDGDDHVSMRPEPRCSQEQLEEIHDWLDNQGLQ